MDPTDIVQLVIYTTRFISESSTVKRRILNAYEQLARILVEATPETMEDYDPQLLQARYQEDPASVERFLREAVLSSEGQYQYLTGRAQILMAELPGDPVTKKIRKPKPKQAQS